MRPAGASQVFAHSCRAACDSYCVKKNTAWHRGVASRHEACSGRSRLPYAQDKSGGRRFLATRPAVMSLPLHQIEDTRRITRSALAFPPLRAAPVG